jgi:hypothetical protein
MQGKGTFCWDGDLQHTPHKGSHGVTEHRGRSSIAGCAVSYPPFQDEADLVRPAKLLGLESVELEPGRFTFR